MLRTLLGFGVLAGCLLGLSGCGGGNGGTNTLLSNGGEQTVQFGDLTTRIAGTVQPPVTSGGSGTVVTGVAGGLVSSVLYSRANPTLAETRIAFYSYRDNVPEIYTIDSSGAAEAGLARLTINASVDAYPSWSPDGTKIVFDSDRDGNREIYVMNADGTGQTRLTNNSSLDVAPTWSPDGTKIVFDSDRDGNREIYVMNTDGTGQTRLTNNTASDNWASWSPDGSRIVFNSNRDGNYEIYVMNATNGSGLTRLTNNTAEDSGPSWSPDGSRIVFGSTRDGNYEIYVMNADGTGQTRLTSNAAEDSGPSWSPDGSTIAFVSNRDGNREIYTMNTFGSNQTRKTNNSADDISPRWSPLVNKRELIGATGQLGTAAAGFLYGQNGDAISSVVTFDTPDASRLKARITLLTSNGPGNSNYVFSITSSDTLTRLAYTNGFYGSPKVVVGTGGISIAPTGAIISFNAATGQVSSILPYISNRSAVDTPAALPENGGQVLRGHFLGIWNEKGQNIAPNGASEVHLNAKTGQVMSSTL